MRGNQPGQPPSTPIPVTCGGSLRQRIVRESISAARDHRRKQPQVFFRAPDFPGTALFDLNNGLEQMPYAKRKRSTPPQSESKPFASQEDFLEMDIGEYHDAIMNELDLIEEASRSNSPVSSDHLLRSETHEPCAQDLSWRVASSIIAQELAVTISPEVSKESLTRAQEVGPLSTTATPPLTRPVTEKQLIAEVKGIYAGLVELENGYLDTVQRQSRSLGRLTDQEWKSLMVQHRALLQDHHDFFSATQHPRASPALKSLASNYAMPSHMWRQSMYTFLELLRHRAPEPKQSLHLFGILLAQTMDQFVQNIPQLSHEWDLIQDNLHEYFSALRSDGVDIPSSLSERWKKEETFWAKFRKTLFPPMQGHFFGDGDFPEWFTRDYLPGISSWSSQDEPHDERFGRDGIVGTAQLVMTGWLSYGRKIATSYHAYCQVFIFLAMVVFAATQIKN